MHQYESNERRGARGVTEDTSVQHYEVNERRGASGVTKDTSVQQYEVNERRGACGVCQCSSRGCMRGNKKSNSMRFQRAWGLAGWVSSVVEDVCGVTRKATV